jgi:hypothetical protein
MLPPEDFARRATMTTKNYLMTSSGIAFSIFQDRFSLGPFAGCVFATSQVSQIGKADVGPCDSE